MARKKKQTRFVIFASPQQHNAPGTFYMANNGSTTDLRFQAAKFLTFDEAKAFAEKNHITLTGPAYIGREDFTESEVQR